MKYLAALLTIFLLVGCDDSTSNNGEQPIAHECELTDQATCSENSVVKCITSSTGKRVKETTACGDQASCWEGTCLNIKCDDQPACTNGTRECIEGENKRRICGNFDNDSCFEWQIEDAPADKVCQNGEWIDNKCTPDTKRDCPGNDAGGCKQQQTCLADGSWGECERDETDPNLKTYYADLDSDGYGANPVEQCSSPGNLFYLLDALTGIDDCNDDPLNGGVAQFPTNTEICDNIDNDCDLQVDGFDTETPTDSQEGICAGHVKRCIAGEEINNYAAIEGYEEQESLCDTLDNDCDGTSDNLTAPADNQNGICAGSVKVCDGEGNTVEPDYTQLPGYEETEITCDEADNDCNGKVDDIQVFSSKQAGVCKGSMRVCLVNEQGELNAEDPDFTQIAGYSETELCDGLDNNCNDTIDENPDTLCALTTDVATTTCDQAGTEAASCKVTSCVSVNLYDANETYSDGCEYYCKPTNPGAEICDGEDNNCNGTTDENEETLCATNHTVDVSCNGADGCGYDHCEAGFFDDDGFIYNGCENGCKQLDSAGSLSSDQSDAIMDDNFLTLFYKEGANIAIREFNLSTETLEDRYLPKDESIAVKEFALSQKGNRYFMVYTDTNNTLFLRSFERSDGKLIPLVNNPLAYTDTNTDDTNTYNNLYISKETPDNDRIPVVSQAKPDGQNRFNVMLHSFRSNRDQEIPDESQEVSGFVSAEPYTPKVTSINQSGNNDGRIPVLFCQDASGATPGEFRLYIQMMDDRLNKETINGSSTPYLLATYSGQSIGFCNTLMNQTAITSSGEYYYIAYPSATTPQSITIKGYNFDAEEITSEEVIDEANNILYPALTAANDTLIFTYQERGAAETSAQKYIRYRLDNGEINGTVAGSGTATQWNQFPASQMIQTLPFYTDNKEILTITTASTDSDQDILPIIYFDRTTPCEDLSSQIKAYFPMDGDDESGHVNDLYDNFTATNVNISYAPGVKGQHAVFNGTDSHIQLPAISEDFHLGITFSVWSSIHLTDTGNDMRFIDLGNGENQNNLVFARSQKTQRTAFWCQAGTFTSNDSLLEDQVLHHYAITVRPDGTVRFFKDGEFVNQKTGSGYAIHANRTSNYIGKSNWDAHALYEGSMDEFFIYNRALKDHEIKVLYDLAAPEK